MGLSAFLGNAFISILTADNRRINVSNYVLSGLFSKAEMVFCFNLNSAVGATLVGELGIQKAPIFAGERRSSLYTMAIMVSGYQ